MTRMLDKIGAALICISIVLFYVLDGEMSLFVGFAVLILAFVILFISDRSARKKKE